MKLEFDISDYWIEIETGEYFPGHKQTWHDPAYPEELDFEAFLTNGEIRIGLSLRELYWFSISEEDILEKFKKEMNEREYDRLIQAWQDRQ